MKNISVRQTNGLTKTLKLQKTAITPLSENALYLMALASQLKKLLGPASLQHFLATGKSVVFIKKTSLS
jgi:hypothetical protein